MSTDKKESNQSYNYSPIYRSQDNRILGGVAGGLGEYFGIDPNIIRLLFILLTIFGGSGIIIYLILWILLPAKSQVTFGTDHMKANLHEVKDQVVQFAHDLKFNTHRSSQTEQTHRREWLALGAIILGGIFLLDNYGLGDFISFNKLWPLLLILLGISIIIKE